jgi:hypothetical protein
VTRYEAALEYIRALDRARTARSCGWTSHQHYEQVRDAERAYTALSATSPGRAA